MIEEAIEIEVETVEDLVVQAETTEVKTVHQTVHQTDQKVEEEVIQVDQKEEGEAKPLFSIIEGRVTMTLTFIMMY